MTDKELYTAVRQLGMKITKTDGEYRVNFRYGKEATAYYTKDRDDALGTARAMVQEREAQKHSDHTPGEPTTDMVCNCPGISFTLVTTPGPHHDDGCPFHELPDYGVFGPDE